MNILSFGLKNIGTIQSLINGAGMIKQFMGGHNNHQKSIKNNFYNQPSHFSPYFNHFPYPYYNQIRPRYNPYQKPVGYGFMYRRF